MDKSQLQLKKPQEHHFAELFSWFSDVDSLREWGGPNLHWPMTLSDLKKSMDLDKWSSFVLQSENQMLGFGQYCLRYGRCHLGRLIISPHFRGRGLAKQLINQIASLGLSQLKVRESSLWVMTGNQPAIRAYLRAGFQKVSPPEDALPNSYFMVRGEKESTI